MLAEYAGMFAVSSIATTLWLGGWLRPFPNWLKGGSWDLAFSLFPGVFVAVVGLLGIRQALKMPKHPALRINKLGFLAFASLIVMIGLVMFIPAVRIRIADIFWFLLKVAVFIYLYIWYRATWPRYRFDQLMKVGWKVLLPLSLAVLGLVAVAAVFLIMLI
jgi:NADH-quinone oxidoreductase subunit H